MHNGYAVLNAYARVLRTAGLTGEYGIDDPCPFFFHYFARHGISFSEAGLCAAAGSGAWAVCKSSRYTPDKEHGRADHVLGPAKGAAALGDAAGDGVEVPEGQAGGKVVVFTLDHGVLFPLGDAFAAFEKMVWHISILYAA